jgi:hypothetical protein
MELKVENASRRREQDLAQKKAAKFKAEAARELQRISQLKA